jgi:hypothetical protein
VKLAGISEHVGMRGGIDSTPCFLSFEIRESIGGNASDDTVFMQLGLGSCTRLRVEADLDKAL